MLRPISIVSGCKKGAACCAPTGGTDMELSKAEEERMVIFLTEINRKLDLIIAAQTAFINKVDLTFTAQKATKEEVNK